MSVNKVQLSNGETIIDISDSTVTPETLAEGVTAHDASGQKITGKMVPGGSKTVQTDWNQTDETAPDFLKNKPFYDHREETVLIEEGEYAPDPDMGMVFFSEEAVDISLGTVYEVYWDNRVVYQLLPIIQDGAIVLGNLTLNTYPFGIIAAEGFGTIGMFHDGMPHNVKITAKTGDVKKIDTSLISADWSATTLKNEDIIIPLANRNFSNGIVNIPYEQDFSVFDGLQDNPTRIKIIWDGVEYSDKMFAVYAGMADGTVTSYVFLLNDDDDIQFKISKDNTIEVSSTKPL